MGGRSHIPKALSAVVGMGILILDNQFAISEVTAALQLCIQTVIPALFPFLVLSTILVSSMGRLPGFLLRLFKVSPYGGSILLTGLLGGYPVGAKTVSEAYRNGSISRAEAQRLLPICNQCGPAFVFGLTMQLFYGVRISALLWLIQLICVLLMARIIPAPPGSSNEPIVAKSVSWSEALQRGIRAMATICGWIVLFRLLIGFLERWFFWRMPLPCQIIISGLLELTNGCTSLHQIDDASLRFIICVGIMGFGGLCVTMQSTSLLHPDLKHSYYFPGKILQTALGILITSAIQRRTYVATWIALPIVFVCLYFFKKTVAFPHNLVYNNPIKAERKLLCSSEKR